MMGSKRPSYHEDFASFFEQPSRDRLRNLLRSHVGELNECDFKQAWPDHSEMARHVLAISNSGGGVLVVGVAENADGTYDPKGIDVPVDKADITKGLEKYLPSPLHSNYDVLSFTYKDSEYHALVGKSFQVVYIQDDPTHIPFVSLASGKQIERAVIYVRRGTNSVAANHEELQRLLNRRIQTEYSSSDEMELDAHLSQLKVLYGHIAKTHVVHEMDEDQLRLNTSMDLALGAMRKAMGIARTRVVKNPNYPDESFEQFVVRMVQAKKRRIERALNL
jgi:predicted HTH transcriptional regulator